MGSINLQSISKSMNASAQSLNAHMSDQIKSLRINTQKKPETQGPQPTQLSTSPGAHFLDDIAVVNSSLSSVNGMLGRMRDLATMSANESYNANDRQSLSKEFSELAKELDRVSSISRTTLDGKSSIQLPPGANTTNTKTLNIGNFTSEGLGLKNIDLSSAANATSAIEAIDLAINKADTQRVAIGEAYNAAFNQLNNSGTYTNPSASNNRSTEAESISASKTIASPTISTNKDRIASMHAAINSAYNITNQSALFLRFEA